MEGTISTSNSLSISQDFLYSKDLVGDLIGLQFIHNELVRYLHNKRIGPLFEKGLTESSHCLAELFSKLQDSQVDTGQLTDVYMRETFSMVHSVGGYVSDLKRHYLQLEEERRERDAEIASNKMRVMQIERDIKPEPFDGVSAEGQRTEVLEDFWNFERRRSMAEALDANLSNWLMCEEKEGVYDRQVELLYSQMDSCRNAASTLASLDNVESIIQAPNSGIVDRVLERYLELQAVCQQDLHRMMKRLEECRQSCISLEDVCKQNIHESSTQVNDSMHRIKAAERRLQELKMQFVSDLNKGDAREPFLQNEVDTLRRQLEAKKKELADVKFEYKVGCEQRFQAESDDIGDLIKALKRRQADASEMVNVATTGGAVKQSEATGRLHAMEDDIETLKRSLKAYIDTSAYIDTQKSISKILERNARMLRTYVPMELASDYSSIGIKALDYAVQLYDQLGRMIQDKSQRQKSVIRAMRTHTRIMNFCVETCDPGAHKYRKIVAELQGTIDQLTSDMDTHVAMQSRVIREVKSLLQTLEGQSISARSLQAMNEFRQLHAAFFNALEGHDLGSGGTSTSSVTHIRKVTSPGHGQKVQHGWMTANPTRSAADQELLREEQKEEEKWGQKLDISSLSQDSKFSQSVASLHNELNAMSPLSQVRTPTSVGSWASTSNEGSKKRLDLQVFKQRAPIDYDPKEFFSKQNTTTYKFKAYGE